MKKVILSVMLLLAVTFVTKAQTIPDEFYYSDNELEQASMSGGRIQYGPSSGYFELSIQGLCEKHIDVMYVQAYAIDGDGENQPLFYVDRFNVNQYAYIIQSMNLPVDYLYAPIVCEWYIQYSDGTYEMKISVL